MPKVCLSELMKRFFSRILRGVLPGQLRVGQQLQHLLPEQSLAERQQRRRGEFVAAGRGQNHPRDVPETERQGTRL